MKTTDCERVGADVKVSPMAAPDKRPENPEAVIQALEIEMQQKRASWQRRSERRTLWRALSFLFLLLVIVAAFVAYFYLQPRLQSRDAGHPARAAGGVR